MKRGSTYIFNLADGTNATHPLRIKSDAGGEQTTTVSGTLASRSNSNLSPAYPRCSKRFEILLFNLMVMQWVTQSQ